MRLCVSPRANTLFSVPSLLSPELIGLIIPPTRISSAIFSLNCYILRLLKNPLESQSDNREIIHQKSQFCNLVVLQSCNPAILQPHYLTTDSFESFAS